MTKTTKATAKTAVTTPSIVAAAAPARTTKTDRLLALLRKPEGASVEEMSDALGWLAHTTRAALTGLRKKGHAITRDKAGSVTVYRIAA
ncbi:MAG: DUF3489 domain-containing protein [Sphingopyxis sp.]|nr:DUF3489 domain-containing protein [Sphingopyxis sp.]